MGSKEAPYTQGINRHIPKDIHHEGIANPFRRGTPDRYYEGPDGHLWVEFKFIDHIPAFLEPWLTLLSAHQEAWLARAHHNRQPVAVIIGSPEGGVILPALSWRKPILAEEFRAEMKTKKQIAKWITTQCLNTMLRTEEIYDESGLVIGHVLS